MSWFLSSLPTNILLVLLTTTCVAVGAAGLLLVRKFIHHEILREHNDVAGFIFAVFGVIYAVTLALVTVGIWEQFTQTESVVHREASVLVNLHRSAEGLPEPTRSRLHDATKQYARLVVEDEWPLLSSGTGSEQAAAVLGGMWSTLAGHRAESPTEAIWQRAAVSSLEQMTLHREERLVAARSQLPPIVWLVLILGGTITVGYTYLYGVRSLWSQLILTSSVSAMVALVVALVLALDHPFTGPTAVSSEAFRVGLEAMGAAAAR